MSGRWANSSRSARLPRDWPTLVAATRDRAHGRCEAELHDDRCDGSGHECDHHVHPDDHRLESLRWLNHWCHQAKTQREAAAGKQARKAARRRLPAPHPGLRS